MNRIKKIFGKNNSILIGAIHFPPLLGYPKFPGFEIAERNALCDLKAFQNGGLDAIIFENNYDLPHTTVVKPEVGVAMTYLGEKIVRHTSVPIGISVLWNDFQCAFAIAKTLGLGFVRVPVFVDTVKTDYGIIRGEAEKVITARKKIGAESVAILADIHVKHSRLLSKYSLVESARRAIKKGADALIVTGKWTGDAPDFQELKNLRRAIGDFPIFTGSGADEKNIKEILRFANGVIVSTSLKSGTNRKGEHNVKGYDQRIDLKKVRGFVKLATSNIRV
jgi:membrane complex biogenesis BtpA family protein